MSKDEVWLSHLRGREGQWLALAGDYPHRLVAHGKILKEVVKTADTEGHKDAMLFFVPSSPLVTTPFQHC